MGAIDLKSNIDITVSIPRAVVTSSPSAGTAADVSGYHSVCFVVDSASWVDGTATYAFQESDDNSTFTAIADADLDGTEPVISSDATGDSVQYKVGYKGNKKYVRAVNTITGSPSTGINSGAYILKGNPKDLPA